jgi:hypothetical protein
MLHSLGVKIVTMELLRVAPEVHILSVRTQWSAVIWGRVIPTVYERRATLLAKDVSHFFAHKSFFTLADHPHLGLHLTVPNARQPGAVLSQFACTTAPPSQ